MNESILVNTGPVSLKDKGDKIKINSFFEKSLSISNVCSMSIGIRINFDIVIFLPKGIVKFRARGVLMLHS